MFNCLKEVSGFDRNNYDKLGHFAQGFVPAIIAREIIIRNQVVNSRRWLNFFIICICKEATESFLGTQGNIWDTQSDMAFALSGAILGLVTLSRLHDNQLGKLHKA